MMMMMMMIRVAPLYWFTV